MAISPAKRRLVLGDGKPRARGGRVTEFAVPTGGQSNDDYAYTNAKAEFEAAMLIADPGRSTTLINGATAGSSAIYVNYVATGNTFGWWRDDATGDIGPSYAKWLAAVLSARAASRIVDFGRWNQGEADAGFIGQSQANADRYQANLLAIFQRMRTDMPGVVICIIPMNRRGDSPAAVNVTGYKRLRRMHVAMAAANPDFIKLMPEMYDQETDGGPHSTEAGYKALAPRYARAIAKLRGAAVSGGVTGPSIVSAEFNGTAMTVTLAHDGGTDITPATGIQGFVVADSGTEVALSGVTRASASTVLITLAAPIVGVATVTYGDGILSGVTDYTKELRDNQAVPLPLRFGEVTAVNKTPPVGGDLSTVWTQTLFQRDAKSYVSGQSVGNQIVSPFDGAAQTDYNVFLGQTASVESADPTFVPAAGGVPAFFQFDGADSMQFAATTFLKNLANDRSWAYYRLVKPPASWGSNVETIIGCGGASGTQAGFQLRYIGTSANLRISTSDGTTAGTQNLAASSMPTTGYVLLLFSYDAPTKAYRVYINTATPVVTGTASAQTGVSVQSSAAFGNLAANTMGLIEDGMRSGVATDQMMTDLIAYLNAKHAITIG